MAPDPPASVVIVAQAAPDVCERLEPLLREAMRSTVRDLGSDVFTASDWDFLAGMAALAEGVRRRRAERVAHCADNGAVDSTPFRTRTLDSVDEITVEEAAGRRGCSPQAVRARIRRGTLAARRDERTGRWWIRTPETSQFQ